MTTADGMEGVSQTQTVNTTGASSAKTSFISTMGSQAMKSLSTPEMWAGAVAGFVAGSAVGFAAQNLLKYLKKRRK
jgi:hypothetical protein